MACRKCQKENEIASMRNADLHTMEQIGELARDIILLRERVAELELKLFELTRRKNESGNFAADF